VSVSLLQLIETRLGVHTPGKKLLRRLMKRSAVAMILQVREGQLHILMIRRAEREGDPWSGHMAFPGGRMDRTDANGYEVAVRETEEEIGILLAEKGECIGRLSELFARPRRGMLGMAVSPFVFRLDREVAFTPNHEVAEVVWVPLEFLSDPGNRDEMIWNFGGARMPAAGPGDGYQQPAKLLATPRVLASRAQTLDAIDRRHRRCRHVGRFQAGQCDWYAALFGQIHRAIGLLLQLLLLASIDGKDRDANAGAEFQNLLADIQRLLDGGGQFMRDARDFFR